MGKYNKKEQEQIEMINRSISELVYEKTHIQKAYRYYHGKRDPKQYKHLEENYGIGTASSIKFVPLVRKHVDVLIGEYLTIPLLPKVSCKDESTISKIHQDKLNAIHDEIKDKIKNHLRAILKGEQGSTPRLEQEIQEIQEVMENNFISEYEIASQNIVDWAIQDRELDFINNRRLLLLDLLVSGMGYFRILPSPSGTSVNLKILNPLHTFLDRNFDSKFHKHSQRVVIRDFMTRNELLRNYGEYLSKEDLDNVELSDKDALNGDYFMSHENRLEVVNDETSEGILGGFEAIPTHNFQGSNHFKRFPVHDVEWLQVDKEKGKFVTNRYRGIRINLDIYVLFGKVENVSRSMNDPNNCTLSVNGMFYSDRNGNPFSIMLATADLQDKYDIISFYKDNLLAESGTKGDWVDIPYLPTVLGTTLAERLMKWKAYKKQGTALIDSSQEGLPPMNTTFGGYDDTVPYQAMQALDLALERIEDTCSTITGVFREKLGGIEQRDAVTNVQVGIRNSTHITKQYYYVMDLMSTEMLTDILNTAKVVYKKGLQGTLILGDRANKIFTALPEHFTLSDFDIHITETSEAIQELETIKQMSFEFSKNNNIDPEIIIDMLGSKSLTKTKRDIKKAIAKKREEMNQQMQLEQQLEQANQQMQQIQQEAQKLQQQVQQLNAEKLKLEKDKLEHQKSIEWYKAKNEKEHQDNIEELKKQHIQAEVLELYDGNPNNDEVKNI